ncbi:hypothetical protein [uncultured Mediterranean phage uvMED]|nr:hypothetical protein [uncultured Mediterranean phage uvMED]|tara:strand:+ start:412 stop:642 length:231 start_codon:yes stop_codon:yes gene_type:complete
MLSRKDYVLLANIIKRNVRGKKDGRVLILRDFLIDLSVELIKDNPNFQFTTFIDAIGKDIIGVDWRFNKITTKGNK